MQTKTSRGKKPNTKLFAFQNKAKGGGICEKCQKESKYLTVDHIIPIAILDMLDETGTAKWEWEENFQIICYPCNSFKASRLDLSNPKTRPLLLELLK